MAQPQPHGEKAAAILRLKKGREKPVLNRHPWVFSGAIADIDGDPQPGDLITIADQRGHPLATATYSPHSQMVGRIISWDPTEEVDRAFWAGRLKQAYEGRRLLQLDPNTNCYRLVFGEADRLPGLIVDRYGAFLVIQCLTVGIDQRKPLFVDLLQTLDLPDGSRPIGIIERSDVTVRRKEGLPLIAHTAWGEPPPERLTVVENGFKFEVDLLKGHKTGFYLDQRENRLLLSQSDRSAGKSILNVFSYTGAFAVYGAAGGASSILNIDSSIPALEIAESNVLANFPARREQDEYLAGDAFQILRDYRDSGRQWDIVVLDPPKFIQSQRDLKRATRGYKDINWLAMRLLKSGGLLLTFSCSGLLDADLFQKIIFGAAVDAGRHVQIIRYLHQGGDHPTALTFPESAYLKGFMCRVW